LVSSCISLCIHGIAPTAAAIFADIVSAPTKISSSHSHFSFWLLN
jgi:hypothetical protein